LHAFSAWLWHAFAKLTLDVYPDALPHLQAEAAARVEATFLGLRA
jgi:hypothetical protein